MKQYPHVTQFVDQYGKTRYRFRRNGLSCYLQGEPGSEEFDERYRLAMSGELARRRVKPTMIFASVVESALKRARTRAYRAKVPFDLDEDDIIEILNEQGVACAISGIPFNGFRIVTDRKEQAFRPSLDRIRPEYGYVKSNTRIVCEIVNLAMNNWGDEPLRKLVRSMKANT